MVQEASMKTEAVARQDFSKTIREDGTIMDVRAFVRQLAKSKLYWVVAAYGLEWNFVLGRVADEFVGVDRPAPDPRVFLMGLPAEYPEYGRFYMPIPPDIHFFKRTRVPAEVLAVRLGVGVEAVRGAEALVLRQTQEMLAEGLPKPTLGVEECSVALH